MHRLLSRLASPKLTVAFFLAMAGAAVAAAHQPEFITRLVLPPFVLCMANLVAAVLTNARFRADLPLLVFHLALVALVALFAFARLTYFDGVVKLTSGSVFEGEYLHADRGPWHVGAPEHLRFSHQGLVETVAASGGYPRTTAQLQWWDAAGRPHLAEITNDRPLVLDQYRIFATRERGFSPLFVYRDRHGNESSGTAQLSDNYLAEGQRTFTHGTDLALPGGVQAWVQIIPAAVAAPTDGQLADLGAASLPHVLVVRHGDVRHEMHPGDAIALGDGVLRYNGLGTWLGYRVVFDPTPPWLVATVLLGVASLATFYARLWRRKRPAVPADLSCCPT